MTGHWVVSASKGYSHCNLSAYWQMFLVTGTHSPGIESYPHSWLKASQCSVALLAPSNGPKYQLSSFTISVSKCEHRYQVWMPDETKHFAEMWSNQSQNGREKKRKSSEVDLTWFLSLLKFHKITAERTFYHKLKGSALTAGNKNPFHKSSPTNSAHPPQILKSSHCRISPPSVHRQMHVNAGWAQRRCFSAVTRSKGFLLDLAIHHIRLPSVTPHCTSGHTNESVLMNLFYCS